jgi:hypothetical protein
MADTSLPTVSARLRERERRLIAIRLQEIENNPLSDEEVAMFEMFGREAWTPERRRSHIVAKIKPLAAE